jgi:hypothetical protein
MVATCVIELTLAIYTLVRYKMNTVVRLSALILVLLAIFQLAEFNVCGHATITASAWARLGYVAITLLPAVTMHLIHALTKLKNYLLVWLAYGMSFGFALMIGGDAHAFAGHICAGNYAIFQLTHPLGGLFFAYYYFWLFIGIGLCLKLSLKASPRIREALILQVFGYLSFILPTGVVNAINPQTIVGIPSVMCGFAVIYALILALGIVPIQDMHPKRAGK